MSISSDLNDVWVRADEEGVQLKDAQHAQEVLVRFLQRLEGSDREAAEMALSEWIFSSDPRRQFDALATIEHLEIRSALPALRQLADEFDRSSTLGGPYDWAWVNRIIGRLTSIS